MDIKRFGNRQGKTIMLLHGNLMCWRQFEDLIPLLEKKFCVYAVSFDGFDGTGETTYTTAQAQADKLAEYIEKELDGRLDLHRHLVRNEAATFFLHVTGDSMLGAGIHDGDLLVVDRSVTADSGRVVIAALDGELTVKRLLREKGRVLLKPANPDYPDFDITNREYVHIWGVVTYVIHKL